MKKETTMKKLTPEQRAQRALDRADDARINELYANGAMGRAYVKPEVEAAPVRRVTVLTSAVATKARAAKAAATRRANRLAR